MLGTCFVLLYFVPFLVLPSSRWGRELIAFLLLSFESKKEGKDEDWIQSSTTPDPGYQLESDNVIIRHQKREPRGQHFPSR